VGVTIESYGKLEILCINNNKSPKLKISITGQEKGDLLIQVTA
jgi:hypothetical protein